MEDLLIETLSASEYPVFLQGSLGDDEQYPDNFFTFWNASSESSAFYDDVQHAIIYTYRVYFYSADSSNVYSAVRQAINNLRSVGFLIDGDGYSVPVDEPTHDGRGFTAVYKKYEN